jgi:hypothetical protein
MKKKKKQKQMVEQMNLAEAVELMNLAEAVDLMNLAEAMELMKMELMKMELMKMKLMKMELMKMELMMELMTLRALLDPVCGLGLPIRGEIRPNLSESRGVSLSFEHGGCMIDLR